MWSDSTIALAWIKTPHEKLKTYVSNRVKTFNTLCPNFDWRHVNSVDNPADYLQGFIHNLKNPTERKKGKLNISEIKEASNFMVKKVQLSAFSEEIKGLSKGLDIKQSKIKNLAPFLDQGNILRVGGRLQKTRLTQDEKHPKLLPAKHRLTKLIMESFHKRYLHVGPKTLFHLVRQEFWPVGDPHDYTALTPGHFLIGRPITSIAEPQLIEKSDNYLSRWQKISKLLQQVWKNWKQDYLNNLHFRNKWQFAKNNVSPNDMVILKNSDLPPYKWRLGRVQEIIKGSDGYVRVVIVNVSNGIVKR
ncbi:hypothetical protein AVEN_41942-1, partial [Araneus ventricosus]